VNPSRRAFAVGLLSAALLSAMASAQSRPRSPWEPANAVQPGPNSLNNPPHIVLKTTPVADPSTSPLPTIRGRAPLTVKFNLCNSGDPDQIILPDGSQDPSGDTLNWQFNFGDGERPAFNADGTFNADFAGFCRIEHTYERDGTYVATLSVTDKHLEDQGRGEVSALARDTARVTIQVGLACAPSLRTSFEEFTAFTPAEYLGLPGIGFEGEGNFDVESAASCPTPPFDFVSLTGQYLINCYEGNSLAINFAEDVNAYSFVFATSGDCALNVTTVAIDGTVTSDHDFWGSAPAGKDFPEGVAIARAPGFRRMVLTTDGVCAIALDSVGVCP